MTKKNLILFSLSVASIFLIYIFQHQLVHLKSFGLLGLFLINIVGGMLIFPSPLIIASVIAAGSSYPPLLVAIIAAAGSSIGDILGYILGYSGRQALIEKRKKRYEIFEEVFHKFGGLFIFLLALIPNPFFDAIGVVAGLFSYSPKKFFLYVFAGRLIRNILLAYLGSNL